MTDPNDDDIDALLGSMAGNSNDSENPDVPESNEDILSSSIGAEDTGDSPEVQAEEWAQADGTNNSDANFREAVPSGTPWVDYIPTDVRPKPTNLIQRLERAIADADAEFSEREQLVKDWFISKKAHHAYYKSWISHGNKYFRSQVIFRLRRDQIQASLLKEEAAKKVSPDSKDKAS